MFGNVIFSNHPHFCCWLAQVDPYDFADPKDILKDLKKDFWEGLESKKWSDRKGSLAALKDLATNAIRLASGR